MDEYDQLFSIDDWNETIRQDLDRSDSDDDRSDSDDDRSDSDDDRSDSDDVDDGLRGELMEMGHSPKKDELKKMRRSPKKRCYFFWNRVGALFDSTVLRKVKQEYSNMTSHTRGTPDDILTVVMRRESESCPTDPEYQSLYNLICSLIKKDVYAALHNQPPRPNAGILKYLYKKVCLKLDAHWSHVIPILSYEPAGTECQENLSKRRFVQRGQSNRNVGTFNDGLERDMKKLTGFMQSKYNSVLSIFYIDDYKTPEYMKALFNYARCVGPNTEIIIYYAGHGQQGSGNWLVCDPKKPIEQATLDDLLEVSLEGVLDEWISQPEEAQSLCLTIVADCCYSGMWVKKLRDTPKYHTYPICIISACGEDEETPENNLVCRMMRTVPKRPLNPKYWATKPAMELDFSVLYKRFRCNIAYTTIYEFLNVVLVVIVIVVIVVAIIVAVRCIY